MCARTHVIERFAGSLALAAVCFGVGAGKADEPLELPPREVEYLLVMPRVTTKSPTEDPSWVYRGAIRPDGTFESPLPKSSNEVNRRQVELLRALDKLRLFQPEDDLDFRHPELGSIADKLGRPETLTIPPRVAK